MGLHLYMILAVMGLSAFVVGAICGTGEEVPIKPMLNAFGVPSVASVSFLSGCTVLSINCYSMGKAKLSEESLVDLKTGTPLAIGATIGGVAGRMVFQVLSNMSPDKGRVEAVQAVRLLLITFGTMLYTLKENKIHTHHMISPLAYILIGLVLGVCSPFLGIGGGPINLVVLFFFFSVDTKMAARNSLCIILFSQITSLINALMTGTAPQFSFILLVLTVTYSILGGVAGRIVNKEINAETVNKLFIGLMVIIMLICVYNTCQFM